MTRLWSINGRFLSQPMTGVQRYGWEIVQALDALLGDPSPRDKDLELEVLVPRGVAVPGLRNIQVRTVGSRSGQAWEQFDLPRAARSGLLSLCNTGPLVKRKQIVCLHDTSTRNAPESYSRAFRAYYRVMQPALGRIAARISTVSHYSADQIARYGIAPRSSILIAPDGHEHALKWRPRHSETSRAAAGASTIVAIGSTAPHKNIRLLIAVAHALASEGFRLALVGARDARIFSEPGADVSSSAIAALGRIDDDALAALLQDSLCLAFPSLEEGFGIPPLEAMAQGCPVISSDRASLPEICGDAALYAPAHDVSAWCDAIRTLRADPYVRSRLVKAGHARLSSYRWTESAESYLTAMAELDGVGSDQARERPASAEKSLLNVA